MADDRRPSVPTDVGPSTDDRDQRDDRDRIRELEELDEIMPPALLAALESEMCDRCGSTDTWWRNCKLLCRACGGIVKSCADL